MISLEPCLTPASDGTNRHCLHYEEGDGDCCFCGAIDQWKEEE